MREFASMDEVVALIRDGAWELGYGDGTRSDGSYWIQQGGLTKGGKSKTVRRSTVAALQRRGLIAVKPRGPKQPFWLRRYEFTGARNDQ